MKQVTIHFLTNGSEFKFNEAQSVDDILKSISAYMKLNRSTQPCTRFNNIKNENGEVIGWFKIEPPQPFELEYLPHDHRSANKS